MTTTEIDNWINLRMDFSDEAKNVGLSIAFFILEICVYITKNGLLSMEDKISNIQDIFLQEAMILAIDSGDPDEVKKILQKKFIERDYKDRELLRALLVTEGIVGILNGYSIIEIAATLIPYFGENYFQK